MFVYFTDGTCINDSEIYGVKAKYEQNKYVVDLLRKSLLQVHPIYQCSD
ncbi:hypothetical protein P647_1856 [Acinetobacter baumannii UH12208]|nr:hypothetical protein P647_1856 [Acinetobacter baumannii UH12208]ETQ49905.1 hypothetical protein P656_2676 [Acinetobacter baumannii UH16208]ETQ58491.1 hypothetical protein P658_2637 [Acinetobacter baumannii UH19608]